MARSIVFLFVLLTCIGCGKVENNWMPTGSELEGELEVKVLKLSPAQQKSFPKIDGNAKHILALQSIMGHLKISYFSNQIQCDTIFKRLDSSYTCENVDFNKHVLIPVRYTIYNVYLGRAEFQEKYIFNYNTKVATFYLNSSAEYRSSGLNSDYKTVEYAQWLLLPIPPDGFEFKRVSN